MMQDGKNHTESNVITTSTATTSFASIFPYFPAVTVAPGVAMEMKPHQFPMGLDRQPIPISMAAPKPPMYIPDHMMLPETLEFRESRVSGNLSVWTKVKTAKGHKFGPFSGILRPTPRDPMCAWEVSSTELFFL